MSACDTPLRTTKGGLWGRTRARSRPRQAARSATPPRASKGEQQPAAALQGRNRLCVVAVRARAPSTNLSIFGTRALRPLRGSSGSLRGRAAPYFRFSPYMRAHHTHPLVCVLMCDGVWCVRFAQTIPSFTHELICDGSAGRRRHVHATPGAVNPPVKPARLYLPFPPAPHFGEADVHLDNDSDAEFVNRDYFP